METKHRNALVPTFLKQPSRSTLTNFMKADLINLAKDLGWSKNENLQRKAQLKRIADGLAVI